MSAADVYFDTGVVVALYLRESFTKRAAREARRSRSLPFTVLHQLEVRNALRLNCGRGRITEDQLALALEKLEEDLDARRLIPTPVDLAAAFERAAQLSADHTVTTLTRSLDLLHVASALLLGRRRFVSADGRQVALARAAGLDTLDLRRGA